MKRLLKWTLGIGALGVTTGGLAAGCSSGSGDGDLGPDVGIPLTGQPCDADDADRQEVRRQCGTEVGTCLTDSSFTELTEGESAEIPGGFCTKLACVRSNVTVEDSRDDCGEGSFCFDLRQYTGMPLGVCGVVCETEADCRDGYLCVDGSSPVFEPLPFKTCLPPELLCLLDIPNEECPNAMPPVDGGMGGMGGMSGGGGASGSGM